MVARGGNQAGGYWVEALSCLFRWHAVFAVSHSLRRRTGVDTVVRQFGSLPKCACYTNRPVLGRTYGSQISNLLV